VKESGYPDFVVTSWNAFHGPAGLPKDIVTKLNAAMNKALASPQVADKFKQLNIEFHQNTPEEFARFVADQTKTWGDIVKEANIKLG